MLYYLVSVFEDGWTPGTMPAVWLRILLYQGVGGYNVRLIFRLSGYFYPGGFSFEVSYPGGWSRSIFHKARQSPRCAAAAAPFLKRFGGQAFVIPRPQSHRMTG